MVLSSVPKYSLREDLHSPRDVYHCLLVQKGILHSSLSQLLRAERLSFFILLRFLLYSLLTYLQADFFLFALPFLAPNSLSYPLILLVYFCHLAFSFYPPFSSCLFLRPSFFLYLINRFRPYFPFLFFCFSLSASLFLSLVLFVSFIVLSSPIFYLFTSFFLLSFYNIPLLFSLFFPT